MGRSLRDVTKWLNEMTEALRKDKARHWEFEWTRRGALGEPEHVWGSDDGLEIILVPHWPTVGDMDHSRWTIMGPYMVAGDDGKMKPRNVRVGATRRELQSALRSL